MKGTIILKQALNVAKGGIYVAIPKNREKMIGMTEQLYGQVVIVEEVTDGRALITLPKGGGRATIKVDKLHVPMFCPSDQYSAMIFPKQYKVAMYCYLNNYEIEANYEGGMALLNQDKITQKKADKSTDKEGKVAYIQVDHVFDIIKVAEIAMQVMHKGGQDKGISPTVMVKVVLEVIKSHIIEERDGELGKKKAEKTAVSSELSGLFDNDPQLKAIMELLQRKGY